jgi:hypothetical protein
MWFQVLFHSPLGVLFTFPSRYWFTIGYRVVFSLRRWASRIHTGFHVTRATWEYIKEGRRISPTGLSPSMARHIQTGSAIRQLCNLPAASYRRQNASRDPKSTTDMTFNILLVWAVPRSLAATDGIACCFLFLRVLRCFNSPGWLPLAYAFSQGLSGFA